jgi:hypothetical protein
MLNSIQIRRLGWRRSEIGGAGYMYSKLSRARDAINSVM